MLLADAMRSEGYRLLRNRMTVFWSVLFVPIALGFGQSIFGQMLPLLAWTPDMWAPQLLLPGLAFDTLKAAVTPNPMMPLADGQWIKALVGLALWCVIPLVAALAWFRRQDLSKE